MHEHAEHADEGERDEPKGHVAAARLVDQQAGELRQHEHVELALAGDTREEFHRNFGNTHALRRGQHQIEQDLEPLAGQFRCKRLEQFAPQSEKAAHRVGEPHRKHCLRHPDTGIRDTVPPCAREAGIVAALDMAAPDGDIRAAL